jgi:hypothetical protein
MPLEDDLIMTRTTVYKSCGAVMAMAAMIGAADAPYMGKWKLNPAKSQLTGQTTILEKTSSGGIRFAVGAISYIVNLDGKEYPAPNGWTAAWRAVDANTWEITNRVGGKVANTYRLSLKDDTLTSVMSRKGLEEAPIEESAVFTRISGGPGFFGTWKGVIANMARVEFSPSGRDGLIYDSSEKLVGQFRLGKLAK